MPNPGMAAIRSLPAGATGVILRTRARILSGGGVRAPGGPPGLQNR
jgi:hypothetical protein